MQRFFEKKKIVCSLFYTGFVIGLNIRPDNWGVLFIVHICWLCRCTLLFNVENKMFYSHRLENHVTKQPVASWYIMGCVGLGLCSLSYLYKVGCCSIQEIFFNGDSSKCTQVKIILRMQADYFSVGDSCSSWRGWSSESLFWKKEKCRFGNGFVSLLSYVDERHLLWTIGSLTDISSL
jgi:hypothetical protein